MLIIANAGLSHKGGVRWGALRRCVAPQLRRARRLIRLVLAECKIDEFGTDGLDGGGAACAAKWEGRCVKTRVCRFSRNSVQGGRAWHPRG